MRLNQFQTFLETLPYPLSAAEVAATLDGQTIDYPSGEESIADIVHRCGTDSWQSADDAWLSMLAALDEAAIGRKYYTDRDPPCGPNDFDPVSF